MLRQTLFTAAVLAPLVFNGAFASESSQASSLVTETFFMQADLDSGVKEQLEFLRDDLRILLRKARAKYSDLHVAGLTVSGKIVDHAGVKTINRFVQKMNGSTEVDWEGQSFSIRYSDSIIQRINDDNVHLTYGTIKRRLQAIAEDYKEFSVNERGCFSFVDVTHGPHISHHGPSLTNASFHRIEEADVAMKDRIAPGSMLVSERIPGPKDLQKLYIVRKRAEFDSNDFVSVDLRHQWFSTNLVINLSWRGSHKATHIKPELEGNSWAILKDGMVVAQPEQIIVKKDALVLKGVQNAKSLMVNLLPAYSPITLNEVDNCDDR